jgi:hypothetical protein
MGFPSGANLLVTLRDRINLSHKGILEPMFRGLLATKGSTPFRPPNFFECSQSRDCTENSLARRNKTFRAEQVKA